MKLYSLFLLIGLLCLNAQGQLRAWTSRNGQVVTAKYVRTLFDDVVVEQEDGKEVRIPLKELSEEDRAYVSLQNPPELSVDLLRSERQEFVTQSPHIGADKYPPTVLMYRFGARVKQKDTSDYSFPLKVVIYALSQQRYDQDKYHYITRIESKPFYLNRANHGRYEFTDEKEVRLIKYDLDVSYIGWTEVRGEKYAESLVLVKDQRDEIIAYNSSKKWLFRNLEKLEKLPVGAWINDGCKRVHPTSPKDTKVGEPLQ